MNIKEKIIHSLQEAIVDLGKLKDDYFLFGSSAMILKGVPIEQTNDIDILVSKRDAQYLKKKWGKRELKIKPKKSALFRSELSLFQFNSINIETAADLEVKKNGIWQKLEILEHEEYTIYDQIIKIPTLEEQRRILQLFGREKDLEKLLLIEEIQQEYEGVYASTGNDKDFQ